MKSLLINELKKLIVSIKYFNINPFKIISSGTLTSIQLMVLDSAYKKCNLDKLNDTLLILEEDYIKDIDILISTLIEGILNSPIYLQNKRPNYHTKT